MEYNKDESGINTLGDENLFNLCVYKHFQSRMSEIDYTFNVGCTGFDDRYSRASKPICVGAFKPNDIKDISKFSNIISERLIKIFKKYDLWI